MKSNQAKCFQTTIKGKHCTPIMRIEVQARNKLQNSIASKSKTMILNPQQINFH